MTDNEGRPVVDPKLEEARWLLAGLLAGDPPISPKRAARRISKLVEEAGADLSALVQGGLPIAATVIQELIDESVRSARLNKTFGSAAEVKGPLPKSHKEVRRSREKERAAEQRHRRHQHGKS